MLEKLLLFIKRPTSRDVIINTFGNYLNVFFVALFALILVRILNPAQYGVLSVLLGIAYVLSNVLDFGTTATIYSYLPPMIEKKAANLYRFVKSMFFYQSLFSIIVIGVLVLSFPYLDKIFFKTKAPVWELYLTCFSVLFLIWQNFANNILFAAKKFLKANIYNTIANIVKTLIIFFMVATKTVGVGSIIFVFGMIGPIVFFLLLFIEKKDLVFILLKSEIKKEEFRFGYTVTYFIASQFFNLGLRMDLFLLSYFLPKAEVGYYGLSQKIILTVTTTIISITQVLSPRFSEIKHRPEILRLFKTAATYMLFPTGLFIALFLTPSKVFDLFFTDKFVKTANITRSLSLPFIFYAVSSLPSLFLLYTVKKPLYILISNLIFFVVLSVGCYILIPTKGVFGPPIVIFVAFFFTTLLQSIAVIKEYRKLPA